MNKTILLVGALMGMLAIILGAFGAHGLEKLVDKAAVKSFETGVKYQMYHALFLLILGSTQFLPEGSKKWIFYLTVIGVLLFSFSIYFLATNSLTGFDFKKIGFITPLGGLFLIGAWALLAYKCLIHFNQ